MYQLGNNQLSGFISQSWNHSFTPVSKKKTDRCRKKTDRD